MSHQLKLTKGWCNFPEKTELSISPALSIPTEVRRQRDCSTPLSQLGANLSNV